jgi:hypothetical protein
MLEFSLLLDLFFTTKEISCYTEQKVYFELEGSLIATNEKVTFYQTSV